MKIILFIFSIIFISIKTQQRIFRFPFKKKESNDKDIIKSVLENKIYTEINIGTPPQKIPVQINLDIFSFYLADPTIKGEKLPSFNFGFAKTFLQQIFGSLHIDHPARHS